MVREPIEDMNIFSPDIWTNEIQSIVDEWRQKLLDCTLTSCPVCKRINLNFFSGQSPTTPCHHCRSVNQSKFSGGNDMDPGEVYLNH
jgi:hypothetical protein